MSEMKREKETMPDNVQLFSAGITATIGKSYRFEVGKYPDPRCRPWALAAIMVNPEAAPLHLHLFEFERDGEKFVAREEESGHLTSASAKDFAGVLVFSFPNHAYVRIERDAGAPVTEKLIERGTLKAGEWLAPWAFHQIVNANGGDSEAEITHLEQVVADGDRATLSQGGR